MAEHPSGVPAVEAFGEAITILESLKEVLGKLTPKKKGPESTAQTLVKKLELKLNDYAGIRFELDTAYLAMEKKGTASPAPRPVMVDSSTDTQLTPHWWLSSDIDAKNMPLVDLGRPRNPIEISRNTDFAKRTPVRAVRSYASAVGSHDADPNADNADDGFTLVERRTRQKIMRPTLAPRPEKTTSHKPPAVLIKVADGNTFEGTLKTVQEAVDPAKLGVEVKRIAKTQEGHVLVEMSGGPKAVSGATILSKAVRENASGLSNQVVQLGSALDLEIVNLDPGVERDDVLAALKTALDTVTGEDAEELKTMISVTGLWHVKDGTKMATVKVPRVADKLTTLKIGWTVARVRPRRPEPLRCYRCHGFGHQTLKCAGPDLTGKCRKCGGDGHLEKDCAESARCVACERLGQEFRPHRTGSVYCLARQKSEQDGGAGPTTSK